MARTEHIHIAYDGPALQLHSMDVKDLAPALIAFSELLDRANVILNDGRAQIRVEVKASFKEGSFGIDLQVVQGLIQWLHSAINNPAVADAKQLIELVLLGWGGFHSLLFVVRKLRGRQLERVDLLPDGRARVLIDDEMLEVEERVVQLLRDYKIRQCLEQLIAKPLEKEGIDTFAVIDAKAKKVLVTVDKAESRYFRAPPKTAAQETIDEYETRVQLLSVVFADGNKWRFSDGDIPFNAAIVDEDYLRRVDMGQEKFAKGDVLSVRISRRQYMVGDQLRTERTIIKVLGHFENPPQQNLVLPPPVDPT